MCNFSEETPDDRFTVVGFAQLELENAMVGVRAQRFPLLLLGTLTLTLAASAATLEVDGPDGVHFPTIQSAIDAAVPGVDEVFVRCGTYPETITMKDQVSVRGENPLCAIIDAQELGPVVTMPDLSSTTVFERFTVQQAAASADAAIVVDHGSPVISRTVIRDNATRGIAVLGSFGQVAAPTITHNIITGNESSEGSALYVFYGQGVRISNNLIVSNGGSAGGGAIFGSGVYSAVISNNTIANNGTVGLRLEYGDADIVNNLFSNNSGGDYQASYFYPVFMNNSGAVPNAVSGPPDLADERGSRSTGFAQRATRCSSTAALTTHRHPWTCRGSSVRIGSVLRTPIFPRGPRPQRTSARKRRSA